MDVPSPIETAPRDGREILIFIGNWVIASWRSKMGTTHDHGYPWIVQGGHEAIRVDLATHWLPVPPHPPHK